MSKLLVIIVSYKVTDLTIDCLRSLSGEIHRVPGARVTVCENGTGGDAEARLRQAIDENGNASSPYICTGTMTGDVYLNECLKKRLIPFIKQHHEIEDVFFWPDLASSHYSKDVIAYLREENVDFVQKQDNPPNVPQALGRSARRTGARWRPGRC